MKNKRNTRRGRAKRWTLVGLWQKSPIYTLRRTTVEVWRGVYSMWWFVGDGLMPFEPSHHPSRAAAMRAAEHLARQAKCR